MQSENEKIKISEMPENMSFEDYSDDTVFIFDDKPPKRDPVTGLIIKE